MTTGHRIAYRPALDGVRAVAVVAVLVFHADLEIAGRALAPGGFLGVSTFFTLSGFLITSLVLVEREQAGGVGIRAFWGRRVRRLMPAALIAITMALLFGVFLGDASQQSRLRGDLLAALFDVANWRFIWSSQDYGDLFASPSPVQQFWSLAIEEQFYIVFPVVVGVLAVRARQFTRALTITLALAVVASVGCTILLRSDGGELTRIYYGTLPRIAEILIGALAAVAVHGRRVRRHQLLDVAGFAGLAVALVMFATTSISSSWLYPIGLLALSVCSCGVVLAAADGRGGLARVLAFRPLVALGLISYGVYLYHWPIFLWLDPERTGLSPWPLFVVRMALTLLLAYVSWALVEQPIRNRRVFVGTRAGFTIPAALGAMACVILLATADPSTQSVASASDPEPAPEVAPREAVRALVVGDVGATRLASALEGWGEGDDLDVASVETAGCGATLVVPAGSSDPTCAAWAEAWPAAIEEHDPDVVLVTFAGWTDDDIYDAAGGTEPPRRRPEGNAWIRRTLAAGLAQLAGDDRALLTVDFPYPFLPSGKRDVSDGTLRLRESMRGAGAIVEGVRHLADASDLPAYPADDEPEAMATWEAEVSGLLGPRLVDAAVEASGLDREQRVLVVGDSVAHSFGVGLTDLADDSSDLLVWNLGATGCGIARGGTRLEIVGNLPDQTVCDDWEHRWREPIREFDPDIVVVLTTVWDLSDRELPSTGEAASLGDPAFDAHLLDEYSLAIDDFEAGGAEVVWLTAPCNDVTVERILSQEAFDVERTRHLNTTILPELQERRPEISVVDFDALVCPGGEFTDQLGGHDDARPDGLHFTPDAARWLAEQLAPDLGVTTE